MKSRNLFYTKDYEKKYKRLMFLFVLMIIIFAVFIYININYIMFKFFISYNYAYKDALDELFIQTLGEENYTSPMVNFDELAIAAISRKISEAAEDPYTYLYTKTQYTAKKVQEKTDAAQADARPLSNDTAYVFLPGMSKYATDFFKDNTEWLSGYKNIVFDLRGNLGGDLDPTYEIADFFLDKGELMATEKTRLGITTKVKKAKSPQDLIYEKIVFLIDGNTASASECLIMALKENLDNVEIIGSKSYGKGIGQYTLPLLGGSASKATVMNLFTPLGNSIHRTGIEPDVPYDKEDIVDFALGRAEGD